MPDSVDSPMGSKSESSRDTVAVQQALATPPLSGEVQALEQWFDSLGTTERAGILYALVGRCSPSELAYISEIVANRKLSDDKFGVFDRLVRDPALEHRAPLRLQSSPIRPYIGKQDHFSQAFLRPQTFNPWPLSQEITRPKSATDWWSLPQPQPIGRPKEDKHHSDGEEPRTRPRAFHGGANNPPSSNHDCKRSVNFMDPELLADIGAWLRSLRLHKYTENLAGMKWQDVVKLDDKQLEARGVNALGARRKMLKMFEEIRAAQEAGKLPK